MNAPLAVYIHSPFCPTKCGYCDFNSYAMTGDILPRTARAMQAEIRRSPHQGRPAKTVFFGGGTPTFFDEADLLGILRAVLEVHPPVPDAEITSESNPGTADASKYAAMRAAGFNRISLGAQSFLDSDLIRLGRVHQSSEIARAVRLAREAGFENLNLDLMFALPGQSLRAWRDNLNRAIDLEPDHLSLYCLTLEPNTPFYKQHLKGTLIQPEEELQVEMYDLAVQTAKEAGYELYEISNFAKPGRECAHNLCYWRAEQYAGYGPGAVGRVGDQRTTILKHPLRYADAVEAESDLICERETVDATSLRLERIMLGIRLAEGIAVEGLEPMGLKKNLDRGWVEVNERVKLTPVGRHYCSEVAADLA